MFPDHIHALIFDCDGTLADTMPAHFRAWRSALTPHGIDLTEDRFYALGGMPTDRIVELLSAEQAVPVDVHFVASEKEAAFLRHIDAIQPVGPIVAIARQEFQRRKMAVASGGYRRVVDQTLRLLQIDQLFSVVVTAEDTKRHKPEPDVFLEAARRLNEQPSACVVFEDTDIGLEAARRAGMTGFDIRTLHQPERITGRDTTSPKNN